MKNIIIIAATILVTAALILSSCAAPAPAPSSKPAPSPAPAQPAAKVVELRFAHHSTGRTDTNLLRAYATKIEQATGGKVKVTVYPQESLVKANQAYDGVVNGVADMAWGVTSYFAGTFPLSEVMLLPFLSLPSGKVDGRPLSQAAINSHIAQELYETTPEIQKEWTKVKVLMFHTSQGFFPSTIKKPISTMADLQGMKILDAGGPHFGIWQLLGASPVMRNIPEYYEALSKGVADGVSQTWAALMSFKLFETLKYWTDAPTRVSEFFFIMNLNTWNSLTPDVQQAIMSVSGMKGAEWAGDAGFGDDTREETFAVAAKAGYKMEQVKIEPQEFEKWRQVGGKPLWDKWVADTAAKGLPAQKIMDQLLQLLAKYK
jgi:TRAP-type C4-dicarboxylate transport system substrate-binding protein